MDGYQIKIRVNRSFVDQLNRNSKFTKVMPENASLLYYNFNDSAKFVPGTKPESAGKHKYKRGGNSDFIVPAHENTSLETKLVIEIDSTWQ
jgi:hypothetical protein